MIHIKSKICEMDRTHDNVTLQEGRFSIDWDDKRITQIINTLLLEGFLVPTRLELWRPLWQVEESDRIGGMIISDK